MPQTFRSGAAFLNFLVETSFDHVACPKEGRETFLVVRCRESVELEPHSCFLNCIRSSFYRDGLTIGKDCNMPHAVELLIMVTLRVVEGRAQGTTVWLPEFQLKNMNQLFDTTIAKIPSVAHVHLGTNLSDDTQPQSHEIFLLPLLARGDEIRRIEHRATSTLGNLFHLRPTHAIVVVHYFLHEDLLVHFWVRELLFVVVLTRCNRHADVGQGARTANASKRPHRVVNSCRLGTLSSPNCFFVQIPQRFRFKWVIQLEGSFKGRFHFDSPFWGGYPHRNISHAGSGATATRLLVFGGTRIFCCG